MKYVGKTSGSKAQNAEWFSSDLTVPKSCTVTVQFSVNLAVLIQYTLDSGSNWFELVLLTVANKQERMDITMMSGDLFNMRTTTIGGATVHQCIISRKVNE